MFEFKLPSLGTDMDEGKLLEWRVKPGDKVKKGQVVAVVDTSKAAVDVEIWQDGTVFELLIEPGTRVMQILYDNPDPKCDGSGCYETGDDY